MKGFEVREKLVMDWIEAKVIVQLQLRKQRKLMVAIGLKTKTITGGGRSLDANGTPS